MLQQLPGSCYLRITHEEMSYCHFFRRTAIPWQDIDRFEVVTLEQNGKTCLKLVGIHFVANSHRETFNRHLTQVMARCDAGLPDTYGMDADELVSMLNACHSRFTGGSATLQS